METSKTIETVLNSTGKIDDCGGDYVVLQDFGSENFSVHSQGMTLEDGIDNFKQAREPAVLVKLVRLHVQEKP